MPATPLSVHAVASALERPVAYSSMRDPLSAAQGTTSSDAQAPELPGGSSIASKFIGQAQKPLTAVLQRDSWK